MNTEFIYGLLAGAGAGGSAVALLFVLLPGKPPDPDPDELRFPSELVRFPDGTAVTSDREESVRRLKAKFEALAKRDSETRSKATGDGG